jgi:hypothetical protein
MNKYHPDGKIIASSFERNCGATTRYVHVVALNILGEKLDPENFDNWVFSIHGDSVIKLKWEDYDKLLITYSGIGDSPTSSETEWRGITISYKKDNGLATEN